MTATLDVPLTAAARGWHVFPLRTGDKRPAVDRWETRATTDLNRIRVCWTAGRYGVGIACGPSGLLVIDLDVPKPDQPPPSDYGPGITCGQDVLATICEEAGQPHPPATYTVRTGQGGLHLYYRGPSRLELRNTHSSLGPLIDTRGHGGYVVAAGTSVNGQRYELLDDAPIADLPDWLADRLTPAQLPAQEPIPVRVDTGRLSIYLAAAVRAELDHVHRAPPGTRNRALYGAAVALGQLVAGGALDEHQAAGWLLAAGIAVGQSEREATRTIASGFKAGARRPRQVAA
ncbi:MAG: DNA primase [Streptosporangiales bacterium]|nr:DNA primase [Streptosporangiales bacterium]